MTTDRHQDQPCFSEPTVEEVTDEQCDELNKVYLEHMAKILGIKSEWAFAFPDGRLVFVASIKADIATEKENTA